MRIIQIAFFLLTGFLVGEVIAQDQTDAQGEIEDVQVIIEKDKPLELPKANRLYERSQVTPLEKNGTEQVDFDVNEPSYKSETFKPKFEPKPVVFRSEEDFFNNYVKVGFGNYLSPLLEAYAGIADRRNNIGFWFRHESFAKGPVRGKSSAFAQNQFKLDGDYITRYLKLSPILNYEREGFYYYGYDHEAYELSPTALVDRYYQDIALFQEFRIGTTVETISDKGFNAAVTPSLSRYGMRIKGSNSFNADNEFSLDGKISYEFENDLSFGVKANSSFANYKSGESFRRSAILIRPGVTKDFGILKTELGVGFGFSKDSASNSYFYPDLMAQFDVNDQITVIGEVRGDLMTNTLGSVYDQNRYLEDSLALINTNVPLDISGKVNIQVLDQFWVQGFIGYEVVKHQLLFKHSKNDTSRFTAVFDPNFGRFEMGGKGVYSLYGHTSVSLSIALYGYDKDSEPIAWFMPHRKIEFGVENTFVKGLTAKMRITSLAGIKAPYTNLNNDPVLASSFVKLDPIVDMGLDLKYDIVDQVDAFFTLNNIFNQRYMRYANYPSRGMTVKIGFIFHF
ncbi:hypothetical protein [Marinoscillum sp. MHG1-6]|uniref:hypothetical protein n=1 Tax=Marinoscillum sp. MHG1-6 TaxID=2959627 RepID=UPI002157C9AD|nr:hypothetical protein [Marinoscillum sp. MHG1-6]